MIRPIPPRDLYAIFNDDAWGWIGLAIMLVVAGLIGFWLAIGAS